jgi:short-subunit dehydrogenase
MPPICIVSGCSRGIGRAVATKLASSGYSLGLLARSEKQLESLEEEVSKSRIAVYYSP